MANRGRKAIPVSKEDLQKAIESVEGENGLPNRTALWQAIAATDWAKSLKLSPQVAMMKAKTLSVTMKTPVGIRGRLKGQGPVNVSGKPRERKKIPLEVVAKLKNVYEKSLYPKIEKAARGSLKAAIALKCIDCCGGQRAEVAACTIDKCSLWAFRPGTK